MPTKSDPASLSQEQRRERRRKIAEYVSRGKTREEAAAHFKLSLASIYDACKEHGVPLPVRMAGVRSGPNTYRAIALLLSGMSGVDVARELGVAPQHINQIKQRCITNGIPLPSPQKKGRVKV